MLLETSRRYNPGSESITFLKDFSYNREDFAKAGKDQDQKWLGRGGKTLLVIGLIVTTETQAQALGGCTGRLHLFFQDRKSEWC